MEHTENEVDVILYVVISMGILVAEPEINASIQEILRILQGYCEKPPSLMAVKVKLDANCEIYPVICKRVQIKN